MNSSTTNLFSNDLIVCTLCESSIVARLLHMFNMVVPAWPHGLEYDRNPIVMPNCNKFVTLLIFVDGCLCERSCGWGFVSPGLSQMLIFAGLLRPT